MRFAAIGILMATFSDAGCAPRCDVNHCPDDLTRSDAVVSYYDGSGNGYIFQRGMVEYRPVKRAESSSLHYSGGEPFHRPIDAVTYAKIARALNTAIDTPEAHTPNRPMLSGAISVKCGDASRDWIIAPGRPELAAIESILTSIKTK
jgi:pyruvate-formate lyase-activating enzyme